MGASSGNGQPDRALYSGESFGHDYFDKAYMHKYFQRNPPRKSAYYLSQIRRGMPQGRLLDIGCAYGAFLSLAAEHYECNGCDVNSDVLAQAGKVAPGVNFFEAALPDVPGSTEYDVVTCFDVLEHVPDIENALKNIRELLHSGGVLCAVVPVYDGPLGWLIRTLDKDRTHVHRVGREWWRRELRRAGFSELWWEGIIRYPIGRYYLHVAGKLLRRVGAACLFVVTKLEEA